MIEKALTFAGAIVLALVAAHVLTYQLRQVREHVQARFAQTIEAVTR